MKKLIILLFAANCSAFSLHKRFIGPTQNVLSPVIFGKSASPVYIAGVDYTNPLCPASARRRWQSDRCDTGQTLSRALHLPEEDQGLVQPLAEHGAARAPNHRLLD